MRLITKTLLHMPSNKKIGFHKSGQKLLQSSYFLVSQKVVLNCILALQTTLTVVVTCALIIMGA